MFVELIVFDTPTADGARWILDTVFPTHEFASLAGTIRSLLTGQRVSFKTDPTRLWGTDPLPLPARKALVELLVNRFSA